MNQKKIYQIFVSYSKDDSWVAKQIKLNVDKCGARTFLYEIDVNVGDEFENKILKRIKNSNELIVLLTPYSKDKKYLWLEIGAAWGNGIKIIAILYGIKIDDISKEDTVPLLLKKIKTIEINNLDDYFSQLRKRTKKK